jgi:hypothetical protein
MRIYEIDLAKPSKSGVPKVHEDKGRRYIPLENNLDIVLEDGANITDGNLTIGIDRLCSNYRLVKQSHSHTEILVILRNYKEFYIHKKINDIIIIQDDLILIKADSKVVLNSDDNESIVTIENSKINGLVVMKEKK